MDFKENFLDNLILFLHDSNISHFYCFINFDDLKGYYYKFFSYPVIEKNEINVEEFLIFQNSNSLSAKVIKEDKKEYSIFFLYDKTDEKNDYTYQLLFSMFLTIISRIELEQCQFVSDFYQWSLHEIMKEVSSGKKIDTFFQLILNKISIFFNASKGFLHIKLMYNDNTYNFDYTSDNKISYNRSDDKDEDQNIQFNLKFSFANQYTAMITLFLEESYSKNLIIPLEKKFALQKFQNILSFIIYSFLFLNEQKTYIENLEEIVVQNKSELNTKNQQLIRQLHTISEIEQSRNLIFSKIYHQLLTPLNSILGFTMYILNFSGSSLSKDIVNDIENIEVNALFLLYNILDIIDYTKIITNNFSYKFEPFNFHQVIENIQKLIIFMHKYFDAKIDFELIDVDFNFNHDYKRVEQIIFTLLFFVLSSKSHGTYNLRLKLDDEGKRKVVVIIAVNSPLIDENYFGKLYYYKENVSSKNFKNFTLEDFLAYCPIQMIFQLEDKIEFEKIQNSFIIKITFYEK